VTRPAWRPFAVRVRSLYRLSPSFLRVTFTGDDLATFADNGYDQRIKLVFPTADGYPADLPGDDGWYTWWRGLPDDVRPPVRTYTARAVRPGRRELDVDLVLHGDAGPASRWAVTARPGDPLVVVGPDSGYAGDHGGVEWKPADGAPVLVAGDETAVPAVCAILSRLPDDARGEVLLEVPHAEDALPVPAPDGVRVTWLARGQGAHGDALVPAVRAAAARLHSGPSGPAPADPAEDELLWEIPAAGAPAPSYAWLAGEAGVIRTLRRHLVGDLGWDRRSVAFMGYWRMGRAEATG
jgi:NADPH-dependent ferric siderophore reductase